jgi:hypothetical protein
VKVKGVKTFVGVPSIVIGWFAGTEMTVSWPGASGLCEKEVARNRKQYNTNRADIDRFVILIRYPQISPHKVGKGENGCDDRIELQFTWQLELQEVEADRVLDRPLKILRSDISEKQ